MPGVAKILSSNIHDIEIFYDRAVNFWNKLNAIVLYYGMFKR